MWMTREQVAEALGIVPNSVRGKVLRGQIERKVEDGKNLYRIVDTKTLHGKGAPPPPVPENETRPPEPGRRQPESRAAFDAREVLLEQLASLKIGRSIDAIEKGDEIDLATGEISRELEAKMSMRQQKQLKEIQEALERLKQGEYGICEDCGEPIPEQRLRLFPAAKLCVRCQEEADYYDKMRQEAVARGGVWREDSTESPYGKSFDE